ncbi:hypothetical protein [Candidatus Marimicrobium litorale]|uniref:DUF1214 domain-containing protein n=1 Tax=Candidatus Marimicrobium litorale TaxID=2518991 RepID=A0ABT3T8H3_9GAMM|nr:hypothetical protein [Candidatus Marimicrobium litorale]MCX2978578.1 hypothetical protein [Candidatus Marimicrobium litorale]
MTEQDVNAAKNELRNAFDHMIGELQAARDIIDSPDHFAPAATDRVLAEGYRYLAGYLHHGIERAFHEDPNFPAFRNALSIFNKATIDNADAIYFYAPIDGRKHYRITAIIEDSRHWRGQERLYGTAIAPQYMIFETSDGGIAGDTGELTELIPGTRTGFGTLDSSAIELGPNGEFELMLGPDKPSDYNGHFICTEKPPKQDSPDGETRYATYISGRQLFHDWEFEEPVALTITPLGDVDQYPAPLTTERVVGQLHRMGSIIHGQMQFWLQFYDVVLNCNGTHENINNSPYFMPVNAYNTPNAASTDTGGGMSTNIYAGGLFDLAEDEALYIEAQYSGEPVYTSFHLGNLWGESPDYANHQSSLNGYQMYMGKDQVQRWVVAHRDPGVQNWLDTTGLPKGYLSHRWAYSELPAKEQWPKINAKKIRFDQAASHFPADQPILTEAQRRETIKIRQRHVQKRFRVF